MRDNQRLGDLAAGTLVGARASRPPLAPSSSSTRPVPEHAAGWDVSAVTAEELAAVRSFLGRRQDAFKDAVRADPLSPAGWPKGSRARTSPGAPPGMPPERFLEDVARVKASRR